MRGSNSGSKQAGGLGFGLRRDVAFWQFGAFAEEELFHLFFNYFLRARVERIQPKLVHHHFRMLNPQLPGFFRDTVIDSFAEFAFPWRAIESRHFLAKLHALHHMRASGCGLHSAVSTLMVCHAFLRADCLYLLKILQTDETS